MLQLKKFLKLYRDVQKLFNDKLCYMLFWGIYSYYVQTAFSFQGCSVKKKLMHNV